MNFENSFCPVCKKTPSTSLYEVEYTSNIVLKKLDIASENIKVNLFKCNVCSHHYTNPQVSNELLSKYYSKLNSEYYNLSKKPTENTHRQNQLVHDLITNEKGGGRILEVGCGYGFLLKRFNTPEWDAIGIEPSPHSSKAAREQRNLNVISDFLDYKTFEPESFDVIMMFDVIEHLKDADSMIDLLKYHLKENGLLVIGTGNIKSMNASLSKEKWGYFSSWEHISFFSPKSIRYLLDQHDMQKSNIIKISYKGSLFRNLMFFIFVNMFLIRTYNFGLKIAQSMSLKKKKKFAKHRLAFDHMIITAKKNVNS